MKHAASQTLCMIIRNNRKQEQREELCHRIIEGLLLLCVCVCVRACVRACVCVCSYVHTVYIEGSFGGRKLAVKLKYSHYHNHLRVDHQFLSFANKYNYITRAQIKNVSVSISCVVTNRLHDVVHFSKTN